MLYGLLKALRYKRTVLVDPRMGICTGNNKDRRSLLQSRHSSSAWRNEGYSVHIGRDAVCELPYHEANVTEHSCPRGTSVCFIL